MEMPEVMIIGDVEIKKPDVAGFLNARGLTWD
jgi:hypothetical protein